MKFIFFSMNDFQDEGGGTIRMQGILNALAMRENEVIFVSNIIEEKKGLFHSNIKHVPIGYVFTKKQKRQFQTDIGILPISIVNVLYNSFLIKIKNIFIQNKIEGILHSFEYLDNSIAFWLKRNKLIRSYINDLHGIAPVEFSFQAKNATTIKDFFYYHLKSRISKIHDKKIYVEAYRLIYASSPMRDYFIEQYPGLKKKEYYILPYLLQEETSSEYTISQDLLEKLNNISNTKKIILFAGSFKKTGGVPDLIEAFYLVYKDNPNLLLMLIGDGPTMKECTLLVKKRQIENAVIFIGRIPYSNLPFFQGKAHIIVCPDRQNFYSDLIIHVKYLDALSSGKIVINGAFRSVLDINKNEELSLLFKPSDIMSLSDAIKRGLNSFDIFAAKYAKNVGFVHHNLTYNSQIHILEQI